MIKPDDHRCSPAGSQSICAPAGGQHRQQSTSAVGVSLSCKDNYDNKGILCSRLLEPAIKQLRVTVHGALDTLYCEGFGTGIYNFSCGVSCHVILVTRAEHKRRAEQRLPNALHLIRAHLSKYFGCV